MDNIYNEPGAQTQQRHLINNTEAELSAGIGTCQEAIATDTGRHCHKDHLGAFKKSALTTELDYVKVSNTDDTPGRLDTKVVKKPSSAITVAVDGTDDHLEIGVDGDDSTIETASSKLQIKDGAVTNVKVNAAAAILESKLSLNYPTHSNANDPSSGEKAALAGTSGTPSGTNKYVTNDDSRNSDARVPSGSAGGDLTDTYPDPSVAKASKSFAYTGVITPSSLSGNTDDWNPTDLSTAVRIRASSTLAINLTGLQGGSTGRVIILTNVGSYNITLVSESSSSSAANRFTLTADLILVPIQTVTLFYDNTTARWRALGSAGATVTAHLFGGASHTADTIANIKTKVSDGSLITSAAGEITALTEKSTPLGVDMLLSESIADSNAKRKIAMSNLAYLRNVLILPQSMTYPNNSDWPLNSAAPIDIDGAANSIVTRPFDSSTEEGVGFTLDIPLNCTGIEFIFRSRAGGSAGGGVVPSLYMREMSHNVATPAWGSRVTLDTITFPANQYYQKTTMTKTLAALSITAGNCVRFELTRYVAHASDTLAYDWIVASILAKFY